MEPSTSKKARQETDFKLCIQCQEPELVNEPSQEAYAKFLQYVHERGQYGDAEYPQISARFQGYTASDLKDKKAKWHRKCYGSTCHSGHLECARVHHQKACQQGESQHLQKRRRRPSAFMSVSDSSAQSNTPCFTRSSTIPFNAKLCFFLPGGQERCSP